MHFVKAKGILSAKNGMNIYRGCTHGCIYCDSRSTCYNMNHPFEDVEVKENAPELLEKALSRKKIKCMVGTGAMCDPYMPCEDELLLTRACLEIIERHGFGACIQTKSDLILRDIDLLEKINNKSKCVVQMTLTTFDEEVCAAIEPNVCTTKTRYGVLKELQKREIPTIVWISPLLPYINDTEENLRGILDYCFDAGVVGIVCFGIGTTMRDGSREHFYSQLDKILPGLKRVYARKYGHSYECLSDENERLMKIFHEECQKHKVMHRVDRIFDYINKFESKESEATQLSLF